MKQIKYSILLIIFIASLISSIALSYDALTNTSTFCPLGEGCSRITNTIYGETFSIPNSHYGIIIFGFLAWLTFLETRSSNKDRKNFIHLSVIIGSLISIYFLYLQMFLFQEYCQYCLVVDIGLILALIIILFYWKE